MGRMTTFRKFIDIGANLTDDMYRGIYHGSQKHGPDLDKVLSRSWANGLDKMIITGGSLTDSKSALDLATTDSRLFATVGCHPTRCTEFVSNPEAYLASLKELINENRDKVVAIGECGLDYERLQFCEKDVQLKYFEYQLQLSKEFNLPLFLHCRAAADDLVNILERNKDSVVGGVVHSFDGSKDALEKILGLGLYVGINGCSLRTKENLEVASQIPKERLMIETDCPWCEVKPTHPGYSHVTTKFPVVKKEKYKSESDNLVKGRNEPVNIVQKLQPFKFSCQSVYTVAATKEEQRLTKYCMLVEHPSEAVAFTVISGRPYVYPYSRQVLEILAAVRKENIDEMAHAIYSNTNGLFFKSRSV